MPTGTVNPMDIAIATMLNADLKSCVTTCAKSATECTTPELRRAFAQISQDGIERQERLTNLMSQKGIYVAPRADQETINLLMPQLQAAIAGVNRNGVAAQANAAGNAEAPQL